MYTTGVIILWHGHGEKNAIHIFSNQDNQKKQKKKTSRKAQHKMAAGNVHKHAPPNRPTQSPNKHKGS